MRILFHSSLAVLALMGLILIGLPHLPASWAGNFIFLSLLAAPIVLLLLGTCIALLIWSKSDWRWIYVILSIGGLGVLTNHLPVREENQGNTSESIRLLVWNVTNFHIQKDTLQKAAAFIRELNPDILCFQERPHENLISWQDIQAAFPEYPYSFRNEEREDEVLNLAIFSKYPLSDKKETYYEGTYNKTMSVEVHAPRPFRLWDTHLQTTQHVFTRFIENAKRRNAQADSLKIEMNQTHLPIIVCGDFNDTPCSYVYRTLSNDMQDAFRKAIPRWTGSFQPMGRWLRIDYILCSDDWKVQEYKLIENPWSDHKMQFAILNLPQ